VISNKAIDENVVEHSNYFRHVVCDNTFQYACDVGRKLHKLLAYDLKTETKMGSRKSL
jgi:hypothetical protein